MEVKHAVKISDADFGFAAGSKQFRRYIQFNLPRLRVFNRASALSFLTETMAVDAELRIAPRNLSGRQLTGPEAEFLETFCALAGQILLDAGLPTFDRATIVSLPVRAATNNRRAMLSVPVVGNVPGRIYSRAYSEAFKLALAFAVPSPRRDKIETQIAAWEERVIEPIRRTCGSGPNCIHLLKAAFEHGVQILHLGQSVYQLGTGSSAVLINRSQTQGDSSIGLRAVNDKWITLSWLRQIGIPTPRSFLVTRFDDALAAAEHLGYPLVIKPSNRERSLGVTVDIENRADLRAAFEKAIKWSTKVLVEERVSGHCHRLVTFRNQFVFAFTRHPKAVVGDGVQSIAELVAAAETARDKKIRYKADKPFPLDKVALDCLSKQDLQPNSIPAAERIVHLRANNTPEDGGYNQIITDVVHPENISVAERISRLFRLESMGLDLVSSDPTLPWYQNGACVTEVNSMPEIGANSARIYVESTFGSDCGSIPVHCYFGDDAAMMKAEDHRRRLEREGIASVLTSRSQTIGVKGTEITLQVVGGLFERILALLHDTEIEVLIVVIQDDELLHRGRPMLHVSSVERVNNRLVSARGRPAPIPVERIDALVRTLEDGIAKAS
jgi:cyanophycin synthetase